MLSDPIDKPSEDGGAKKPRPAILPVVVPIEQIVTPAEWMSEWSTETTGKDKAADVKTELVALDASRTTRRMLALAESKPTANKIAESKPNADKIAESKPNADKDIVAAAPTTPPSRFTGRNISLAILALVIVAQAGAMAFWMLSGRVAAAPPETGSVTVTSEPTGSPVAIDGVPRGVTPLTLAIAPGPHRVEVGGGPQLRTQNVTVTRGGDSSMHLELAPAVAAGVAGTGGLQITTEPAGGRVWVDGEARGIAPVTIANLKVGDHAVTVRGGSGEAVNRTVTVQEAAVASLIISMGGSGAFASGWLAITSGVPMQILEKGALIGTTDTARIMLPAGTHELELVNAALGYRVSRSVQVSPGQTTTVGLKPPMGVLSINALPWAEVWIDGQRAGETPIGNFSIAIGDHEVLFRHPELGEQRKTVIVGAQAPVRVGVDMRKQ